MGLTSERLAMFSSGQRKTLGRLVKLLKSSLADARRIRKAEVAQRGMSRKAAAWQEKYDADFAVREGVYARLRGSDVAEAEAHAEAVFKQRRADALAEHGSGSYEGSVPTPSIKKWLESPHTAQSDIEGLLSEDYKIRRRTIKRISKRKTRVERRKASQVQSTEGTTTMTVEPHRLTEPLPASVPTLSSSTPPPDQGTRSAASTGQPAPPHSPSSSNDSVANFAKFLQFLEHNGSEVTSLGLDKHHDAK